MSPTTWELWEDERGDHAFFPGGPGSQGPLMDGKPKLVWTVEVLACEGQACDGGSGSRAVCFACYCAAMQARNDHLGFGPYNPPEPW